MTAAPAPVEVAVELRRRIARDALLDPFGWVGIAVVSLVLASLAGEHAAGDPGRVAAIGLTALGVSLSAAIRVADLLLFGLRENDFLRTQPLGPRGLLRVRSEELALWTIAPRILAAAAGYGAGGIVGAAVLAGAATLLNPAAARAAIDLRSAFGRRGLTVGSLPAVGGLAALFVPPELLSAPALGALVGVAAGVAGIGHAYGRGLERSYDRRYDDAASAASIAQTPAWRRLWRFLERVPAPAAVRARLVRDLVLLARGWDGRALLLLGLSPLAGFFLAGELQGPLRPDALLWRVLQAAALGGAAVAYAAGPGVHILRNDTMVWERTAPRPGRRALVAAHAYAAGFALAHSAVVLAVAAASDGGRHLDALGAAALAVPALELAMAHYTVSYTATRTQGRRVAGEATLAFALPVVAVAVAGASMVHPALGLVYFVATAAMFGQGVERYEAVEVTW